MPALTLPPLTYADWVDTRDTLHLFLQIIGKVRLKAHPKLNHWWHVTVYPNARGFTTGLIPHGETSFEIAFDMIDHRVLVTCNNGKRTQFDVAGCTVAGFYRQLMTDLAELGVQVDIYPVPYDNKSTVPFPEDDAARPYDADAVTDFWRATSWIAGVFEVYRSQFNGKQTPVQLYWHSFDLVVTRFSGKAHPLEGGTPSDQEAYSHEVISIGFWPGDDTFQQAAFYAYAYPEPPGLADVPLRPAAAQWTEKNGGALAILPYEELRTASDPGADLLAFLNDIYQGAGKKAGWPLDSFEHSYALPELLKDQSRSA